MLQQKLHNILATSTYIQLETECWQQWPLSHLIPQDAITIAEAISFKYQHSADKDAK